MSITFEQVYSMLQTLNIDIKKFNEYLSNTLEKTNNENKIINKPNIINTVVKSEIKKVCWGDMEDECGYPYSDTMSMTSISSDEKSCLSAISDTSSECEKIFEHPISKNTQPKPILTNHELNTNKKSYINVISNTSNECEKSFKYPTSKKNNKKYINKNTSTNPILQDYGLDANKTVFNGKEMAIVLKEKWELGTEYQLDYDSLCPTMMSGNICTKYCEYIHLQICKFEYNSNKCTKTECMFLHARDLPNAMAKKNFKINVIDA